MSTVLATLRDKHGYELEIYDGSGVCELFIKKAGQKGGIKFAVQDANAEKIIEALRISRNLSIGERQP